MAFRRDTSPYRGLRPLSFPATPIYTHLNLDYGVVAGLFLWLVTVTKKTEKPTWFSGIEIHRPIKIDACGELAPHKYQQQKT
jgi:hypothetical protein